MGIIRLKTLKKLYFSYTEIFIFYTFFILLRVKKGMFLYFCYTGEGKIDIVCGKIFYPC